jgi:nitrous oxide reductase accessory protein NosL
MKKILSILLTLAILVAIAVVAVSILKKDTTITIVKGNIAKKPLPIKLNKTNDTECAMLIKTKRNAVEAIAPDGRTWFFDDPGCMVKWLVNKPFKDKVTLWVHTLDTNRWIDAKKAFYGVKDHTAMHYGFGAREKESNETISFKEMQLRMLRGENLTNPKYRKKLLGI